MKVKKRTKPSTQGKFGSRLKYFVSLILIVYLLGLWMANGNVKQQSTNLEDPNLSLSTSRQNQNKRPSTGAQLTVVQSTHPDFPREPKPRPPLGSIIQGWNITGDPSWLLNLAIIGFPKTGTSTLMRYLHRSPQVQVFDEERCEMGYNQHVRLMESLYKNMPEGDYIRGIKCPRDLEVSLALQNYQTHFPNTNFMVGLRHPIEWFESFYNFRVNNMFPMPPADQLTGRCTRRHQGLCTFRGNFHLFLANLGKTQIANNPQEQALIPEEYRKMIKPIVLKGRIFLWEISQLKQDDAQFRQDLQQFLRLEHPLPEMIHVKPGYSHRKNETLRDHVSSKKIDICEDQYQAVRGILLRQGTLAAQWIREYFLQAEGVFVSQKEQFSNVILKSWEVDPCVERATQQLSS